MSEVRQFVHRPSGLLRRYVREILWIRSDKPRVQALLPETILTLVLRQSGSASLHNQTLPATIVSGLQPQTRIVEHSAASSLVIVRFTEVGAPAILHQPADHLYDRTQSLDAVLPPREIDQIQNSLSDARNLPQQVLQVEQFLTARIRPHHGVSPQIETAVQMIHDSQGRSSIAAIARYVAMSQSALERHFRAAVGASPKKLSRLARLHHVCRLWHAGRSLTDIAYAAGYTDQSHLVRDFQLFTGTSPERFFRSNSPINLPTFYK